MIWLWPYKKIVICKKEVFAFAYSNVSTERGCRNKFANCCGDATEIVVQNCSNLGRIHDRVFFELFRRFKPPT